jgi:hypothetical protein
MIYIPQRRTIAKPRLDEVQRFGLSGRLRSVLIDHETGRVSRSLNRNIIVRDALADIPPSLFGARAAYVTKMAVGTGITAPTDTDSALTTESLTKTITEPLDEANLTGATPYVIVTVQFLPGEATGALTEAGLKLSTNDLVNHALFGRGVPTAATQTDPVVVTDADHGLENSQRIRFDGIVGMVDLNWTTNGNVYYYVNVLSSSTFELFTDVNLTNSLDGTGFSAFVSGGTWTLSIDKTVSNTLFASFEIQVQNAS